MALIPVQHVVADNFNVDPDWSFTSDGVIEAGQLVKLDSNGYVDLCDTAGERPIGIAGDNLSNVGGGTPYSASLSVGANGSGAQSTQNRVTDFFNETLSSGKMTVYHAGGRFLTDKVENVAFTPGAAVYAANNGNLTSASAGAAFVVGVCVADATDYPSGIPGVDVQGSLSLGEYLDFVLVV
jgi:hypothetical protein